MSEQQTEKAPPNSLPSWAECEQLINEGDHSPKHRFIYDYDDADPVKSAWFLHRLELVIEEAKSDLAQYKEDAEKWRAYVEQKNAVINAGMGRHPFRKEEDV